MNTLPKFRLPMLSQSGTYRAFEVGDEGMKRIVPKAAIVVARMVVDFAELVNGSPCVVVTKDKGVLFRTVYRYDTNTNRADAKQLALYTENFDMPNDGAILESDVLENGRQKATSAVRSQSPTYPLTACLASCWTCSSRLLTSSADNPILSLLISGLLKHRKA